MDGSDNEENEHFLRHHDDDAALYKHWPRQTLLLHTIFFILYVCLTVVVLFAYPLHSSSARLNTLSEHSSPSLHFFSNRAVQS